MIKPNELPKGWIEALLEAIPIALSDLGGSENKIEDLKKTNHPIYNSLVTNFTILKGLAKGVGDDNVRELLLQNLEFNIQENLTKCRQRLENCLNALISLRFDEFELNEEDVQDFDKATLDQDDKSKIRQLLAKARAILDEADDIRVEIKRKVSHHIQKIENQLYRKQTRLEVCQAAVLDLSETIGDAAKNLKPVASLFREILGIAEGKTPGYAMIEREQSPKQIEGPKDQQMNWVNTLAMLKFTDAFSKRAMLASNDFRARPEGGCGTRPPWGAGRARA